MYIDTRNLAESILGEPVDFSDRSVEECMELVAS